MFEFKKWISNGVQKKLFSTPREHSKLKFAFSLSLPFSSNSRSDENQMQRCFFLDYNVFWHTRKIRSLRSKRISRIKQSKMISHRQEGQYKKDNECATFGKKSPNISIHFSMENLLDQRVDK